MVRKKSTRRRPSGRRRRGASAKGRVRRWFILFLIVIGFVLFCRDDRFCAVILQNKFVSKLIGTERQLAVESIKTSRSKKTKENSDKREDKTTPRNFSGNQNVIKMGEKPAKTSEKDRAKSEQTKKHSAKIEGIQRNSAIYFVRISGNGDIKLNRIIRKVEISDSPLQSVVNTLLCGLSDEELAQGNLSLIPDGTKLRDVTVSNGVATMDFSEEFMFNTFGDEGLLTQLKQVVYTATEFPTVKSVQFLIEGTRREFIAEGIYIGTPMSRNSF